MQHHFCLVLNSSHKKVLTEGFKCHWSLLTVPARYMSCEWARLRQTDGRCLSSWPSGPSVSAMSPSAHNLSLEYQLPTRRAADYTVNMSDAATRAEGLGRDTGIFLVLHLECPHEVADLNGWTLRGLVSLGSGLFVRLAQKEPWVGANICWRRQHHQNTSQHCLSSHVSLVRLSSALQFSSYSEFEEAGFLTST